MSFATLRTDTRFPRIRYSIRQGYRGQALQIQVKRGIDTITYDRTHRRAHELLDSPGSEYGSFFHSSRHFAEVFRDARILDLGCGNGGLVSDLRRLGIGAHGLDLYFDLQSLPRRDLIPGDAFHSELPASSFDLITSSYSVYHYEPLARLQDLLRESLRILAPGGRILLSPIHEGPRLTHLRDLCRSLSLPFWQTPENKAIQILKIPFGNLSTLP
ncbi:class I SAM-dependent methyltransferase [bacterium]|jgi:SAM-dependent methyltransferase|nr:class I SAM-dependent methyltransferase [bacterium]